MINVQNGHSLQSMCEVRKWKHVIWDFSIPLLGYQFPLGHVTSSDQGLSFPEERAWERGWSIACSSISLCMLLNS
jgi:hypothetical protein